MNPLLGKKVKCMVTGFTGIATARVEFINGCVQICVKPKAGKDGKMPDGEYIDIHQIEIVGNGVKLNHKETGGPQMDTPTG